MSSPEKEQSAHNVDPEEEPFKDKKPIGSPIENKSFFEKIKYMKDNITVEPIFAGLVISSTLARLAVQNLNLDKACRVKLKFGDEICNALINKNNFHNISLYEREAQKVISSIEAWKSIIQTAIPTVLVIYMGAWSDRTGNRKICILLPVFGEFLVSLCNNVSTFFFYEIPVEVTMALEGIFPAITGGWVMTFLGVFSYLSDVTEPESRTFRIGIANLCLTAGIPIGTALSGVLLKLLGYYGIFSMSAVIYMITICYGLIYLKSNTKPHLDEVKAKEPIKLTDVAILLKETAEVALRKRDNSQRLKIILTLVVVAIIYGPNHGERALVYLYTRYKLGWDAIQYSIYSTYSIITHSIGALFSITVFSKRWGFHDSALCLISVLSKFAGSFATGFVSNNVSMFFVPMIEILNATTFTSLRSMASKLVGSEEMGKMNSLFSLVETLAALVCDPAYSWLYLLTLPVLPGAVFFFSAFMTLPAASVLVWVLVRNTKEVRQQRMELNEKGEKYENGTKEAPVNNEAIASWTPCSKDAEASAPAITNSIVIKCPLSSN